MGSIGDPMNVYVSMSCDLMYVDGTDVIANRTVVPLCCVTFLTLASGLITVVVGGHLFHHFYDHQTLSSESIQYNHNIFQTNTLRYHVSP
jgi:hypothetical protein